MLKLGLYFSSPCFVVTNRELFVITLRTSSVDTFMWTI